MNDCLFQRIFPPTMPSENLDDVAVERFVQYIQIKTVQPEPDYASAMKFLQRYAEELNLEFTTVDTDKDRQVALLSVSRHCLLLCDVLSRL